MYEMMRKGGAAAVRVRLAVEDNGEPSQSDELYRLVSNDSIFREIYRHLRGGDRILIHCHMGAQRSAAVAACFLLFLWSHRKINRPLDVDAVIRIIRRKRAEAFPRSVHFMSTIERYYAKALQRRRGTTRRRRRAT